MNVWFTLRNYGWRAQSLLPNGSYNGSYDVCVSLSLFQASHIDTTHNEEASQPAGDCSSQPLTKKSDRSAQWPSSNVIFIRRNRLCTPLRNIIIDFVTPCNIFWVRWVCFALESVVHHKKLRGEGHNLFFLMELTISLSLSLIGKTHNEEITQPGDNTSHPLTKNLRDEGKGKALTQSE